MAGDCFSSVGTKRFECDRTSAGNGGEGMEGMEGIKGIDRGYVKLLARKRRTKSASAT